MHFGIIALVFGIIFISELPDKTLFATLILSTRYHSFTVWLGAATAFFIHVILAVTFGHFLTFLPHRVLEAILATMFFLGAALVFFGKHGLEEKYKGKHLTKKQADSKWVVFGTAFGVIFIGEWGDLTQIITANYAAKYHDPLSVAIGSTLGLWAVAAIAVIVGTRALTLIPPKILLRITGTVLTLFGIASLLSVFGVNIGL
ncbi:MAG: TMEM165/GDT1 family protein [Candidatus Saccharimonadales bacterium]